MNEVYEYLKGKVYYLATMDGDQPRVRPFGAVARFEDRLYICTNVGKPVYKQMTANPRIELSAMDDQGGWVRVRAVAVPDDRAAARARMLEENPNLKGSYAPDDGLFAVLWLKDAEATFEGHGDAARVVRF